MHLEAALAGDQPVLLEHPRANVHHRDFGTGGGVKRSLQPTAAGEAEDVFAVQSAVDLARRGGSVCLIGFADGDVPITPRSWLLKEVSVVSSVGYVHEDFDIVMGMMADGRVRVGPLHTSTIGLDGLVEILTDLGSGSSEQIKVLVDPNA